MNRSIPIIAMLLTLSAQAGTDVPLATIDGKPVSRTEVEATTADELLALQKTYERDRHDLVEAALNRTIEDRIVAAEAAARGISREQVLEFQPAAVTDADVDAFYEANKAQIPRPKAEIAAQIRSHLEQQRQQEARQKLIDGLRQKHGVQVLLEPLRIEIEATGPSKGPASAPVTIVEFSDFQCPYCKQLTPTLDQVVTKYGDKVRLVFRQFPLLAIHANAAKAAEASLCASEQNRFWPMHDALFAKQDALGVDQLKATAVQVGLDGKAFAECLDSGRFAAASSADLKAGTVAGVSGTPALFINGRFLSGAVPIEQISVVIDDELRRKAVTKKP